MKLANEPIIKHIAPAAVLAALVAFLTALGLLTQEQGNIVLSLLSTFGVGAGIVTARSQAYGPVTFDRATRSTPHGGLPVEFLPPDAGVTAVSASDDYAPASEPKPAPAADLALSLDEIPDGEEL